MQNDMLDRRMMSVKECAEYLHVHTNTIYKLCKQKDFPVCAVAGKRKMIDKKRLDEEWIPSRCRMEDDE